MALFDSGPNIQNNNTYDPYGYHGIKPAVIAEISELQSSGNNIQTVDVVDSNGLDGYRQGILDKRVAELEGSNTGAEDFRADTTMGVWTSLLKRAIALHVLYHPDGDSLASGVDRDAYDVPLFDGLTANQVIEKTMPSTKASKIISDYNSYINTPVGNGDIFSVGARDFFKGVVDAKAIRTRAETAGMLIMEHFNKQTSRDNRNLISASLGCGAASPVYKLVKSLEKNPSVNFAKILLVDQDPMALATAHSLSSTEGLQDKIELHLSNLISSPITSYIEPESVDVVDLLGLFEYLPEEYGVALLQTVKEIVKPSGVIIFGNMLASRPQQDFFANVVRWPRLKQRSINDVYGMILKADLDLDKTITRIPHEGVYAIYGCTV